MVTNPGQTLLSGINTALTFGARRPDETLGAYRLANTNRLVTLNQAESANQSMMDFFATPPGERALKKGSNLGADGSYALQVDPEEDPTSLGPLLANNGAVSRFTDSKGNIQTAKSVRVAPAPGGEADRFVIEIENQDGVFAPKTVGASQDPNDPVRIFTGNELRELGSATLSSLAVDSGRDVFQGRLLAQAGLLRVNAEAASIANEMSSMNPAMASQFLETFKQLPYEQQLSALQDFGVDTDAMLADANKVKTETLDPKADTSNLKSFAGFYTRAGVEAEAERLRIKGGAILGPGLKGQNRLTALALADKIQDLEDKIRTAPASELQGIRAEQKELNDRIQAIFDNPDARKTTADERRLRALQRKQQEQQQELDDLFDSGATVDNSDVKRIQQQMSTRSTTMADLEKKIGPADDQLDVTNSITGTNDQRIRLTKEEIQTALRSKILKPTSADYDIMRNFLRENNITTFEQVKQAAAAGRIVEEDKVRIAALIAFAQPTLTAGSAKAKSPIDAFTDAMNEMETGRMSPKDAETLRISAGNLRLSNEQFIRSLETSGSAADDKLIEEFRLQDGYLLDDKGRFKDSDEINLTGSKGVVEAIALRSMSPDRAVRESNTRGFYRALATDLGAFAQTEGAPSWGDFFIQFFQKDTAGVVGGFQDRIMIRNIGGRKSLVFKNADGETDQNFSIPFSDLRDRYSNRIVAMLERDIPPEPAPRK